ncbi:gluconate 2-dehydrogenase subunit 3 family protein [Pseudomonas vanderleydeniana]|uniref:Gluconate 2-dehydrogenase subunit 3 family protein n=1 Tax=Pseudomonas vanderleydeniana TaxID=2745495 RepID=A0A9E6PR13_9PSED|nr:gluconate 2-dehydrogenase subunit 3 family protein [Pseudomonas vanderleydeniana]QXI30887.1 gluconate 2-dehydrogenase subunit 3 family protein [Pseudomonas vanderleydeniana]
MNRREALISLVQLSAAGVIGSASAGVIRTDTHFPIGTQAEALPRPPSQGDLEYLTPAEAREVAALFDRLIPEDELGMGASQAGCVVFLDRQLAGPYGQASSTYRLGPCSKGTPEQGPQFRQTPAQRYREGLAHLGEHCQKHYACAFSDLMPTQQDDLLRAMEAGSGDLPSTLDSDFFALLLQNVREGYLADPMYGGNRDMVGWKLVGFPGARYDYRPYIHRKGMALNLEPVSLLDKVG